MARHEDVAALVKEGHSPAAIARGWNVPLSSIRQYIYTAVGRGLLYRSEILFTVGASLTNIVEVCAKQDGVRTRWDLQRLLRQSIPSIEQEDLDLLLFCFDLRAAPLADMYELLSTIQSGRTIPIASRPLYT